MINLYHDDDDDDDDDDDVYDFFLQVLKRRTSNIWSQLLAWFDTWTSIIVWIIVESHKLVY